MQNLDSEQPKKKQKKIKYAFKAKERHWVGDGFYVHGLLRPHDKLNDLISPFVLLDYASPKKFEKTSQRLGVGSHPHRGFETVTFAFQGEVEHKDSSGGGGVIKEGDVQWMTAGSGVVHEEFHSQEFAKKGGIFEMVQLWVNLPKKDKMTPPRYQALAKESFPTMHQDGALQIRVIAGEFAGKKGSAQTFSPINILDLNANKKGKAQLQFPAHFNTVLLVLDGEVEINQGRFANQEIVIFTRDEAEELSFMFSDNFKGLILNGEPLNEPVVAHGPFVMNSKEEIVQAFEDFHAGKMGRLPE